MGWYEREWCGDWYRETVYDRFGMVRRTRWYWHYRGVA